MMARISLESSVGLAFSENPKVNAARNMHIWYDFNVSGVVSLLCGIRACCCTRLWINYIKYLSEHDDAKPIRLALWCICWRFSTTVKLFAYDIHIAVVCHIFIIFPSGCSFDGARILRDFHHDLWVWTSMKLGHWPFLQWKVLLKHADIIIQSTPQEIFLILVNFRSD